jgi:hypothetical protein
MTKTVLASVLVGAALVAAGCAGSDSADPVPVDARDVTSLGATHVYQVATPDGEHHSETSVVDQVNGPQFRRRTTFTNSTDYTTHTYVISDGAQHLVEWWRYTEGFESSRAYSPPALVHPADLADGATATSVSAVTITGPVPGTTTVTREVTVDGPEQVTVPAGRFTALRTTTVENATTTIVQWWVAGTGRVKMVAFDAAAPASVTTWELVSSSP